MYCFVGSRRALHREPATCLSDAPSRFPLERPGQRGSSTRCCTASQAASMTTARRRTVVVGGGSARSPRWWQRRQCWWLGGTSYVEQAVSLPAPSVTPAVARAPRPPTTTTAAAAAARALSDGRSLLALAGSTSVLRRTNHASTLQQAAFPAVVFGRAICQALFAAAFLFNLL